jgi:O-antigen ligase
MSVIVTLAILSGQLIKIPIASGGISILDITIILFTFYGIAKLKFNFKKIPPHIKIGFIFLLICLLSLLLTPLHLQPNEYLVSISYTVRIFFYILFGFLYHLNIFPKIEENIENILIYSGTGLAILGLLQFIFLPDLKFLTSLGWDPHYFRTVSTFLDPNFAGAFFTLTLIILLSKDILKKKYLVLFLLVFIALLTTFSRSSYLMFLVSGFTLAFLNKNKKMIGIVILLFCILIAGFQIYTQLISKPRNINREESASYRINTWQQGLTVFQKSPVLGVGFNSYKYSLKEYKLADDQFLNSHGATSNDSSLLFVASTTGIIGVICYLYFLLNLYINKNTQFNKIVKAGILGLLVHSIFANSLFFTPILFWLLVTSSTPKR